jgi:hypothetical protein
VTTNKRKLPTHVNYPEVALKFNFVRLKGGNILHTVPHIYVCTLTALVPLPLLPPLLFSLKMEADFFEAQVPISLHGAKA